MQVVLLCGGKSTRTQEYQKGNKCFYEFNSKYFIEYIIDWLIDQGLDDIYLIHSDDDTDKVHEINRVKSIEGMYRNNIVSELNYFEDSFDDNFILMFGDNYYPELDINDFIRCNAQVVGKSLPIGGYYIDYSFVSSRKEAYSDLGIYRIERIFFDFLCNLGNLYKSIFHAMVRYYQKDLRIYDYQGICFDVGSIKGIQKFKEYIEG